MMTTWASVSLNEGFLRGNIADWLLPVALAFYPRRRVDAGGRHSTLPRPNLFLGIREVDTFKAPAKPAK
ncbi:hypothetical protein pipiens_006546 [Culex pipiens pipiens]|uniref:Uncharacterized protein n=1 Tax=Culex pipiens pipiens TaxID=38569 RepID=A0ABD1DQQ2_CULPP